MQYIDEFEEKKNGKNTTTRTQRPTSTKLYNHEDDDKFAQRQGQTEWVEGR
jgi:hypothetical protein